MSHELPSSMRILETSKLSIVSIITKENISLGMLPTFSLSLNLVMDLFNFSSTYIPPLLSSAIISMIFLFTTPFDNIFRHGNHEVMDVMKLQPLVKKAMNGYFPLRTSSSSLKLSLFFSTFYTNFNVLFAGDLSRRGIVFYTMTRSTF